MTTDFRQLRHLVALAETGSFSRAADALGLSQPALSRSIANIEDGCGERLFDRTAAGVVPTAFAWPLIDRARALIASMMQFEDQLDRRSSGRLGRLAFGTGPLVASLSFARVLPAVLVQSQGLEIVTRIGSAPELAAAVADARIEFAIYSASGRSHGSDFTVEPAGRVHVAYMVRPDHPLAGRRGLTLRDLDPFPLASGAAPYEESASPLIGRSNSIVCENFHIMQAVAADSDVIWLGSPDITPAGLKPLTALDVGDDVTGEHALSCVYLRERTLSPQARFAIQRFRACLGGGY